MTSRDDRPRTVYISVVAAVIASVLTTYGLRALEGGSGGGVVVPNVTGVEVGAARDLLRSQGLTLTEGAAEPSTAHPAGHVVRQSPAADSEVDEGSAVEVVTSSGPPSVEVPDIVGVSVFTARERLSEAGLTVGDRSEGGSGDPGTVTASDPPAGTEVEAGSAVAIVVAPEGIAIPEITGRGYRQVRTELEELGFTVVMRRGWNEMLPPMTVLGVEPEEGTLLPPGSEVTVRVND